MWDFQELPAKMKEFLEYLGNKPTLMECLVEMNEHISPMVHQHLAGSHIPGRNVMCIRLLLERACMSRYYTSHWWHWKSEEDEGGDSQDFWTLGFCILISLDAFRWFGHCLIFVLCKSGGIQCCFVSLAYKGAFKPSSVILFIITGPCTTTTTTWMCTWVPQGFATFHTVICILTPPLLLHYFGSVLDRRKYQKVQCCRTGVLAHSLDF